MFIITSHTHAHTYTSVCHTTSTLSLPSVGRGWVQIPPLLLEKCQSLWLPCREVEEEEEGRKEGKKRHGGGKKAEVGVNGREMKV